MVDEIVWIYGSSAVGKETFIRYLAKEKPQRLIKRLHWENKKLIPIWESINYIAQYDNDPLGDKREEIIDSVCNIKGPGIALIKGQDIDILDKRVQRLKEKLPKSNHRIIYLYTDLKIVYERCKKKSWWPKEGVEFKDFKGWTKSEIELINSLNGFDIIALNNENNRFRKINFPPKI